MSNINLRGGGTGGGHQVIVRGEQLQDVRSIIERQTGGRESEGVRWNGAFKKTGKFDISHMEKKEKCNRIVILGYWTPTLCFCLQWAWLPVGFLCFWNLLYVQRSKIVVLPDSPCSVYLSCVCLYMCVTGSLQPLCRWWLLVWSQMTPLYSQSDVSHRLYDSIFGWLHFLC